MSEYEIMQLISDNIKYELRCRNMSQNDLSRITGLSRSSISYYVNAKRLPTLKHLINICVALDCNINMIVPTFTYVY